MMHISPCGWYCFDLDTLEQWQLEDTSEKTILIPSDNTCKIELISARKVLCANDDEISQFHEEYLEDAKVAPTKTVMSENNYKVKYYVTKGTGPDERFWIVAHAFWNNYCVFVQYKGIQTRKMASKIQTFYNILSSLQPLADT